MDGLRRLPRVFDSLSFGGGFGIVTHNCAGTVESVRGTASFDGHGFNYGLWRELYGNGWKYVAIADSVTHSAACIHTFVR